MVYRLVELDTLLFTHCMSMLERLLLYKSGRQLFPVQLDGNNGNEPTGGVSRLHKMLPGNCIYVII